MLLDHRATSTIQAVPIPVGEVDAPVIPDGLQGLSHSHLAGNLLGTKEADLQARMNLPSFDAYGSLLAVSR